MSAINPRELSLGCDQGCTAVNDIGGKAHQSVQPLEYVRELEEGHELRCPKCHAPYLVPK